MRVFVANLIRRLADSLFYLYGIIFIIFTIHGDLKSKLTPILLGFVSFLMQLLSFFLIAQLVQSASDLNLPDRNEPFYIYSIMIFLALSLSSIFLLMTHRTTINRSIEVERSVARWVSSKNDTVLNDISKIKSPHYIGRMSLALYEAIIPTIGGAICLMIMSWIDPKITFIILAEVILIIPFYVTVAKRGAGSVRGIISSAKSHVLSIKNPDIEDDAANSASSIYLSHYKSRVQMPHNSNFVAGLTIAIIVSTMVYWFSIDYSNGKLNTTETIIYLLLLRHFGTSARSMGSFLTRLGTFTPYMKSTVLVYIREEKL